MLWRWRDDHLRVHGPSKKNNSDLHDLLVDYYVGGMILWRLHVSMGDLIVGLAGCSESWGRSGGYADGVGSPIGDGADCSK